MWSTLRAAVSSTPPSTGPRPLLLFVHGFLGSIESFRKLPEDLVAALAQGSVTLSQFDVDNYDYETSGSNDQRVTDLITHLLQCADRPYVIILAHSMGGLMAADAAVALMGRAARQDGTVSVKVRGVLAFDSPFFGLGEHVATRAGVKKVSQTVESVSGILGAFSSVANAGGASGGAAAKASASAVATASTSARGVSTAAAATKSSSTSMWGGLLAVAAVAATAYASSSAVQDAVHQGVKKGVDVVSKHAQFLGPLWQVDGQEARLKRVVEIVDDGEMLFRCHFLQLPAPTTAADKTPGCFIRPPPTAFGKHFVPITVPPAAMTAIATDEIDAHMHMFDERMGEAYFACIMAAVDMIKNVERKWPMRRGLLS